MTGADFFNELFVLEMANNHLGSVERGLKIVGEYGAGGSLQQRARRHQDCSCATWIISSTGISRSQRYPLYQEDAGYQLAPGRLSRSLVKAIRQARCIRMATPFDEKSVDICVRAGHSDS